MQITTKTKKQTKKPVTLTNKKSTHEVLPEREHVKYLL